MKSQTKATLRGKTKQREKHNINDLFNQFEHTYWNGPMNLEDFTLFASRLHVGYTRAVFYSFDSSDDGELNGADITNYRKRLEFYKQNTKLRQGAQKRLVNRFLQIVEESIKPFDKNILLNYKADDAGVLVEAMSTLRLFTELNKILRGQINVADDQAPEIDTLTLHTGEVKRNPPKPRYYGNYDYSYYDSFGG